MSAWLDNEVTAPYLSPLELAEWLRTLPSGKIAEEARKSVARRVLDREIDSRGFQRLLVECRWDDLGIIDERDANVLVRFFRTKQREATLAEAARQSAAMNRSLRGMKGEMVMV